MFSARPQRRLLQLGKQSLRRYFANGATATAPETITGAHELIFPDSQNAEHHDLPSFLEYASRNNMDTGSTTYVGTHYEYMAKNALERLGMSLKQVGGRSDCGIDLLGTWPLPTAPQPLKVLIQCKAFAAKIKPAQARELEGTFVGAPQGWRTSSVLAFLVSQQAATKGVREALGRSQWPMGYVLCGADGKIMQMLWNRKAADEGLGGLEVEMQYTGVDQNEREVILTHKGKAIKN
ncbi:31d52f63-9142-4cb5-b721-38c69045f760-CDS [Sclerotinia trifoliorum]|uniref:31d52f63-9142-4cb5-b721-38c69045f760-CDS n=1 Tax=Sclerotinia trifoliorum TaxID=28548 RepID=A0A8H2VRZ3_9HELO|nr:31d52f63-9142-4cb5-b721-38c69045f760-CDS [Sclerotinia trifoliorum]